MQPSDFFTNRELVGRWLEGLYDNEQWLKLLARFVSKHNDSCGLVDKYEAEEIAKETAYETVQDEVPDMIKEIIAEASEEIVEDVTAKVMKALEYKAENEGPEIGTVRGLLCNEAIARAIMEADPELFLQLTVEAAKR